MISNMRNLKNHNNFEYKLEKNEGVDFVSGKVCFGLFDFKIKYPIFAVLCQNAYGGSI